MTKLTQLADEANKAHTACEKAANSMLAYARQAGEALRKAKQELSHGSFTSWIEQNCRFCPRQARKYMLLANGWDELSKRNHGSVFNLDSLSMREALRILSSGGPEEIGDFAYVDKECPSCGKRLARTSTLYVTCVECFDCKLHYQPLPRALQAQKDHTHDLGKAKSLARSLPNEERADLLTTIFGVHLDEDGISRLAEALKSAPQTDRIAKAKDQLRKLVAALGD